MGLQKWALTRRLSRVGAEGGARRFAAPCPHQLFGPTVACRRQSIPFSDLRFRQRESVEQPYPEAPPPAARTSRPTGL